MLPREMQLKILMPFSIFTEKAGVLAIVAETRQGSLGILPNRLDCVAVLEPGIFSYTNATKQEIFIAVDGGVLVKTGCKVMVSTRRAIGGSNLDQLHSLVKEEFRVIDEQEKIRLAAMLKLEARFLKGVTHFQHQ